MGRSPYLLTMRQSRGRFRRWPQTPGLDQVIIKPATTANTIAESVPATFPFAEAANRALGVKTEPHHLSGLTQAAPSRFTSMRVAAG